MKHNLEKYPQLDLPLDRYLKALFGFKIINRIWRCQPGVSLWASFLPRGVWILPADTPLAPLPIYKPTQHRLGVSAGQNFVVVFFLISSIVLRINGGVGNFSHHLLLKQMYREICKLQRTLCFFLGSYFHVLSYLVA